MDAADRIDAYVDELGHQLRVSRRARRRILAEVRAHLLDAAEAEQPWATDASGAAQRAVLRFGPAAETAGQFSRRAGRRNALLRRALVPSIAAFAVTSTAATVWAFDPGRGPSQSRQAPSENPIRHPAVRRLPEQERLDAPSDDSGRAPAHGR
jgi:HAAS domain-containing protein